jgi:hypothetical protein
MYDSQQNWLTDDVMVQKWEIIKHFFNFKITYWEGGWVCNVLAALGYEPGANPILYILYSNFIVIQYYIQTL